MEINRQRIVSRRCVHHLKPTRYPRLFPSHPSLLPFSSLSFASLSSSPPPGQSYSTPAAALSLGRCAVASTNSELCQQHLGGPEGGRRKEGEIDTHRKREREKRYKTILVLKIKVTVSFNPLLSDGHMPVVCLEVERRVPIPWLDIEVTSC